MTQEEIKDQIRIAGEMAKALHAFREYERFLLGMSTAIAEEGKLANRRDALQAEVSKLEARKASAESSVVDAETQAKKAISGHSIRVETSRVEMQRFLDETEASKNRVKESLKALESEYENRRRALDEELESKRTEIVSINSDLELLRKRLGA